MTLEKTYKKHTGDGNYKRGSTQGAPFNKQTLTKAPFNQSKAVFNKAPSKNLGFTKYPSHLKHKFSKPWHKKPWHKKNKKWGYRYRQINYYKTDDIPKVKKLFLKRQKKYFILVIKKSPGNLFLTYSNNKGQVLIKKSCGNKGFSGKKRRSIYAAEVAGDYVGERMKLLPKRPIQVKIKARLGKKIKGVLTGLLKWKFNFKLMKSISRRSHSLPVRRKKKRL